MKVLLLITLMASVAYAAPRKKPQPYQNSLIEALREPHELAIQSVKRMGPSAYEELESLAFGEKWPMKTRWKAFMLLTHVKKEKSLQDIERALNHNTWYMRSAGLTALQSLFPGRAKQAAVKVIQHDKALMVKMKALEILKQSADPRVYELFWAQLQNTQSEGRKKSLWMRTDMARILMKKAQKKDLSRWTSLLHDQDQEIQVIAAKALSDMDVNKDGPLRDVSFWKAKYPNKNR